MSALVSQNMVLIATQSFIVRSRNVRITLRNFSVCIMRLHMVHLRRIQSFGEVLCGTCLISQVPFATKEE